MKEIPLTKGYVTIVDDEDYDKLIQYKWFSQVCKKTVYARRSISKHKKSAMHRDIFNHPKGFQIDHIDGNGLNNTRANLRVVTSRGNAQNKHIKKWHLLGVVFDHHAKRWQSKICINGKSKHLGCFSTEQEASDKYFEVLKTLNEPVWCGEL